MRDDTEPAERTVREERTLSPMRKTIANRLAESYRNAVHVTLTRRLDAEPLFEAANAAADETVDPSLLDALLYGLSGALDAHPAFNATFEDGVHRLYEEHNVGVAVAIEDGLVTPVVPAVGEKSIQEIARRRRDLTRRVTDGDYTMGTFRGGTITVSNLGPFGVESFTPVINPPEIAILGVGSTAERAVPTDDRDITVRRELPLSLSFDHRVVDGADAARFLDTLAETVTTGAPGE